MRAASVTLTSGISDVINGIIELIKLNIIAKTDIMSDVNAGDVQIKVANAFHFTRNQEIVLIDYGYNDPNSPHYNIYEYARIKKVIDTRTIELYSPTVDAWLVSDGSFVQKTIGHAPLYDNRVYYGDRAVIPSEDMAITVEPLSMSNDWMYLMGGLSREFRVSIMVYGKDIETEQGLEILNKYTDAVYQLMMSDLHPDINNYDTPLLYDVTAGSSTVIVADTVDNRENFTIVDTTDDEYDEYLSIYDIQDNENIEQGRRIDSISFSGGEMSITLNRPFAHDYLTSEYATFTKHGRYFYDSRIDNVEYGTVQKGSAFIRAARLNWFGKEIEEHRFPQFSKGVTPFPLEESSSDYLEESSSESS